MSKELFVNQEYDSTGSITAVDPDEFDANQILVDHARGFSEDYFRIYTERNGKVASLHDIGTIVQCIINLDTHHDGLIGSFVKDDSMAIAF